MKESLLCGQRGCAPAINLGNLPRWMSVWTGSAKRVAIRSGGAVIKSYRASFEPLEERRLLSVDNGLPVLSSDAASDAEWSDQNPGGGQDFLDDQLDWGDAPDGTAGHNYQTLAANEGARHLIVGPWLGSGGPPDAEPDGRPTPTASGDDGAGSDDEDGVTIPTLVQGQTTNISVVVNGGGGTLAAWIDFNGNGVWDLPVEEIYNRAVPDGPLNIPVTVPAGAVENTFARFRIGGPNTHLPPWGPADSGEVEDHPVEIELVRDWGDAPEVNDEGEPLAYPTRRAAGGASHTIDPGLYLGGRLDADPNGQPDPDALGDDNDKDGDDEDGVTFSTFRPGMPACIEVMTSAPGYLNGWIDFGADGSWDQPLDHVITPTLLDAGMTELDIIVPELAKGGSFTFARFRFSSMADLPYFGPAGDGEVEDYKVFIEGYDWGDAPDDPDAPYNPDAPYDQAVPCYHTLEAHHGARHAIVPGIFLGKEIDAEWEGQPEADALGDDNDGDGNDDDGVSFDTELVAGQTATITVTASKAGFLNAWFDFNSNGDWEDPGEYVFSAFGLDEGENELEVVVPDDAAVTDRTFARFRYSVGVGRLNIGEEAADGEVEDYKIEIHPQKDWGDAPDTAELPGYPTLKSNDGARHQIEPGFHLGDDVDGELDGQPNPTATGDDLHDAHDEDGVTFTSRLIPGFDATVEVVVSVPDQLEPMQARLDAWIDFNGDGSWAEDGDRIFDNQPLIVGGPDNGLNRLVFPVPATATVGIHTFARFRLSEHGGLPFHGFGSKGEVEDYRVPIAPMDFGDAPQANGYPTLLAGGGAQHAISPDFHLGNLVDAELDGLPHPGARGDDTAGLDDEDGVTFDTVLLPGSAAQLTVTATLPGDQLVDALLQGWIDFDGNGNWAEPGEQVFVNQPLQPGANVLIFEVPFTAVMGATFARFRLSSVFGLSFAGLAPDGEVEDYMVDVLAVKWAQPPQPTTAEAGLFGWGEESVYAGEQIAADNWDFSTGDWVTGIVWWGSFRGWRNTDATPVLPDSFQVTIWDDVPAGVDRPWSHPGEVVWEYELAGGSYDTQWAGWVYDPRSPEASGGLVGSPQAAFRFEAAFTTKWFPSSLGQGSGIYWVSVAAQYDSDGEHAFGWTTRPPGPNSPDAAVRVSDPTDASPGDTFVDGEPIFWPSPDEPWDLAFELIPYPTTDPRWSQPPEPYVPANAYTGWDELSIYSGPQIVADDWLCRTDQPVTEVHWWGSFDDWYGPQPPVEEMPDAFHIGIWTDVPAEANDPASFSHPGTLVWQSYATDYQSSLAGWSFDPSDDPQQPQPLFYFDYDLPESDFFWQAAGENVYWISISAVYGGGVQTEHPFGWTTRPRDAGSPAPGNAVRIFDPTAPGTKTDIYLRGEPIYSPEAEHPADMAFVLIAQDLPLPDGVVGRRVFYNNSAFDGNDPEANAADDQAIATDKRALLPGATASLANYTSYALGINGLMVDITGVSEVPTAADFQFRVGNGGDPGEWPLLDEPAGFSLRPGEGTAISSAGGSDRVTIIWPEGAIRNEWLQVTVLPTDVTGLAEADVFYFGNAVAESGNSPSDARVNALDVVAARNNPHNLLNPAPVDDAHDYNRDKRVDAADMLLARNNQTHLLSALELIAVPAAGQAAAKAASPGPSHSTDLHRFTQPQAIEPLDVSIGPYVDDRGLWFDFDTGNGLDLGAAAEVELTDSTGQWSTGQGITGQGITGEISISGVWLEPVAMQGNEFTRLTIPGSGYTDVVGEPLLPVVRRLLTVPEGVQLTAEIDGLPRQLPLADVVMDRPLLPLQESVEKLPGALDNATLQFSAAAYLTDGFAPATSIRLVESGYLAGQRLVMLEVAPISYNPVSETISIYDSLTFNVGFKGGETAYTALTVAKDAALQHLPVEVPNVEAPAFATDPGRLLIVVHDDFVANMTPYIAHKTGLGWTVDVADTSTAGTTNGIIRSYIQSRYDDLATRPDAVLLVGDTDRIAHFTGFGTGTPPTDLYYGCMEDGGDWQPEFPVGRFSVANTAQLDGLIAKTIWYETSASGAWMNHATFMAGQDQHDVSEGTHNYVIENYLDPQDYVSDKLYESTYGATTQDVRDSLNEGTALGVYSGHGSSTSWADGPVFSQSDVRNLANAGEYPLIFSFACVTGAYHQSESFTETWVRQANKAAVIAVGSSVNSYWTEDDILERKLFQAIYEEGYVTVGNAWLRAKDLYREHFGSGGRTQRYFEMYNILGDPTLRVLGLGFSITSPADLPRAYASKSYEYTLQVSEGVGPYTWSVVSGELPDGLNLDADTGLISGVPSGTGTWQFTIQASDSTEPQKSNTRDFTLKVYPYSTVVGRHIFYNNSLFDGQDPGTDNRDDNAIAGDKPALMPGQTATFANYTSYSRGINGVMVDFAGLPDDVFPGPENFEFKVGNDHDPDNWDTAEPPASVELRSGDGDGGSDRVTITWDDGAITGKWLQVTALASIDTGLSQDDVFYFGNAPGESGNSPTDARVNAVDVLLARNHPHGFLNQAPIDFNYDYNRDGKVNATDLLIARSNQTHFLDDLNLITAPAAVDKLAWCYELEPVGSGQQPDERSDRAEQAVDALLALMR